ncbi:MAG: hypothetical protein E5X38_07450 [Mesorhizobium sp.]|uniref:hypothetical protein n=1 Tax=unclassified Mesorhizobium TaxID=325217 RepID=UPI000FCC269D|nr:MULTISPECIES: hypothetical protein [unclassified Mesorhizobium]RUV20367.1 hypothetical protein EOA91_16205 [Mesorhizobium sp. M1A.F.Ca.IN.022.04.1.1]RUV63474.1 hypothetical protein EOA64_08675 [Mesorhizobium sp. M1A.F.Ca.IN.022.02.1.1]RWG36240.1 MAG: hypothetical protein EOQ60_05240 [Mesorhizobium sp.]RWH27036.1 MAG: hypothetical protein EOQ75_03885 [Mesorhizobium sp.]TIM36041.1 MAG: hypothetical protein E5Y45_00200 [Mesorhizobium sp.]
MATYYVRSGAAGAGTGADWANAYTTLVAALAGKSAGDVFYVSEDHAESQASAMAISPPGTIANPTPIICVNHLGSVPPVSADLRTTATITTTGTNNISFSASGYYKGITFNAGTGAGGAQIILPTTGTSVSIFEDCSLRINSTGNGKILLGNGGVNLALVELINSTVSFGAIGQGFTIAGAAFRWRNTASALLGTIPTTLFDWTSGRGGDVLLRGVDLSAAGSGKTIIGATGSVFGRFQAIDCKLNASVTKATTPTGPGVLEPEFYRSGSSGVNYNINETKYSGTLDEELTIVRTGGASDGTTPLAWKIVTSANTTWYTPFTSPPIAIWNDTTGSSVTATVQGIWGGGAAPNNDEIWVEVEYLGDASSPRGSFANDSKADPLASAAGQTAGSGTWGGSTTKFELAATFTPQQKGWILVTVKAAKPSSTFYIDPKVTLT